MHHKACAAGLAALFGGLVLAGCGSDPDAEASRGPCADPTPAASMAGLPPGLDLPLFGTFTKVVRQRGFVNATAVTDGTLSGLQQPVSQALEEAGYSIVGSENEIIEADIFFARGQATTGGVKFIEGPCEGQVTIRLFVSS